MSFLREQARNLIPQAVDNHIWSVVAHRTTPRKAALDRVSEFVAYNQIEGDYLEFGCCGAHTFRYAFDAMRARKLKQHLYGFDSFEGLPKSDGVDVHPNFPEGTFTQSQEDFERVLQNHGINPSTYTLIKGFYREVLTQDLKRKLPLKKAAVIYIDCDLYESTREALYFVVDYLQTGTVICFDDYFCYNGDPDRGESLAKKEFLAEHTRVSMRPYFTYGWHGKAFICKLQDP